MERDYSVVDREDIIQTGLMSLDDATKECERKAKIHSNRTYVVVRVITAFRANPTTASQVPLR